MLVFVFVVACGDDDAGTETTDECPVTCSADSDSWGVSFECEEDGQSVQRSYEDYTTTFVDGEPHVTGVVEYAFQGSGNTYRVDVEVVPCDDAGTGYCITAEATGEPLGDQPVVCRNY